MTSRLIPSFVRFPGKLSWASLSLLIHGNVVCSFSIPKGWDVLSTFPFQTSQRPFPLALPMIMAMDWEPLPPRDDTSSRMQRRRRAARGVTASEKHLRAVLSRDEEAQYKSPEPFGTEQQEMTMTRGTAPQKINNRQRKPNRPGFNSYLKVNLDDAAMDRLHRVATRIQSKVQYWEQQRQQHEKRLANQEVDTGLVDNDGKGKAGDIKTNYCAGDEHVTDPFVQENEQGQSARIKTLARPPKGERPKQQRPLSFKARSRASLHMTLFFGGEYLCELPGGELQDWYDKVRARLERSHFFVLQEEPQQQAMTTTTKTIDDYWFHVTEIRMFPPGRNNLIVAELNASEAWHTLHSDIRDIAQNANSALLNEVVAYGKERWTAHITLGNVVGGASKGQVRQAFTEILQEVLADDFHSDERENLAEKEGGSHGTTTLCTKFHLFKVATFGISMGGPVPKQVQLDWNFTFKPPPQPSKSTLSE
jgi:2'-5' RNA ligase